MVRFPFDHCVVIQKQFNIEEIVRQKIGDDFYDEPVFICDVSDIVTKYKVWKQCFPRVIPFYGTCADETMLDEVFIICFQFEAVKCNDHPVMIQIMAALGAGFDCASKNEILKVMNIGVPDASIVFAQSVKIPSHIQCAVEKKVKWLTFDNEAELFKIQKLYPTAE